MKFRNALAVAGTIFLLSITIASSAQQLSTSVPDHEEGKYLVGVVTTEQITSDTSFGWWASNSKYFKAKPKVVESIQQKADSVQYVLFLGTWCHDSQQLLPAYLKSLEAAGVPDKNLTLIAVDRKKVAPGNLHKVFNVVNVPTIIVMKQGKEMGRIEEFGKTSLVDVELADLLNSF